MKEQPATQYDKFIDYVNNNDLNGVKSLFDYIDPNFNNAESMRLAITGKKKDIIYFLAPHIDFNRHGTDLLVYASAVFNGDIETVEYLIENHGFINEAYNLGILNASLNGNVDIALYLIENFHPEPDHEWEPIVSDLANTKNIEILKKYMEKFSKHQDYFHVGTSSFILARAVDDGLIENVKVLLKYTNPHCQRGLDYLMYRACLGNKRDIIDILYGRDNVNLDRVMNMLQKSEQEVLIDDTYIPEVLPGTLYLKSLIKMQEDKKILEDKTKNNKAVMKNKIKKI